MSHGLRYHRPLRCSQPFKNRVILKTTPARVTSKVSESRISTEFYSALHNVALRNDQTLVGVHASWLRRISNSCCAGLTVWRVVC